MSSMTEAEKHYFEIILGMHSGYVLDFTNATFKSFFNRHGINIYGLRYEHYGTSKAKRMRVFWETESDSLVAGILSEVLDIYEAQCTSGNRSMDSVSFEKAHEIIDRLSGEPVRVNAMNADGFLRKEFEIPSIQKLPVESAVYEIISDRIAEARKCLSVGANLSVIFQCGSVLEAVLLGAAQKESERFNRSTASPKPDGKVKRFQDWTLAEFIHVASQIGILKPDVQKFSHGLREFRNYIHPYQQMTSGFKPDEHTARLCLQVLKAALADVAGDR